MKKTALYITGKLFPLDSGDAIYSFGNLERIAQNYQIDVLVYKYNHDVHHEDPIQRIRQIASSIVAIDYKPSKLENLKKILIYGDGTQKYTNALKQKLHEILQAKRYDVIFIDHLSMFFVYQTITSYLKYDRTKLVLIQHNIEHVNIRQENHFKRSNMEKWKHVLLHLGIEKLERKAIQKVDFVWTISEEDKKQVCKMGKDEDKIHVIAPYFNYPRIKKKEQIEKPTYKLLLLGSMSWYPNVVGTLWFIEEVFQRLIKIDPRYRLYIVGNNPASEIQRYRSERIIVTGAVPSVDDYIEMCDFLIVPNVLGGGAKIKILEGIMKGIPILTTKESLVGYPEEIFGTHFCVNNAADFVERILYLNQESKQKVNFVERGRQILKKESYIKASLEF